MNNLNKYGMLIFWALMVGALMIFVGIVLDEFKKQAGKVV